VIAGELIEPVIDLHHHMFAGPSTVQGQRRPASPDFGFVAAPAARSARPGINSGVPTTHRSVAVIVRDGGLGRVVADD
jgi:hypothetical protein